MPFLSYTGSRTNMEHLLERPSVHYCGVSTTQHSSRTTGKRQGKRFHWYTIHRYRPHRYQQHSEQHINKGTPPTGGRRRHDQIVHS
mmetsp:Transcript_6435/g.11468  ORF Transcript_6435/g.11468 Transcript_6435/m.11468 type:complete len:86 (+) Transcript_6435:1119-1376(+)